MNTCPFCHFSENYRVIFRWDDCLAILAKDAVHEGQTIIIPKRHVENYDDLMPVEINSLFNACRIVIKSLKDAYAYSNFNLIINSGIYAGQSINHLHIHLLPRQSGDVDNPRFWLNDQLYYRLRQPSILEFKAINEHLQEFIPTDINSSQCDQSADLFHSSVEVAKNYIGENSYVDPSAIIGYPLIKSEAKGMKSPTSIGRNSIIRSGTIIYEGVTIGSNFDCGHNVLIRHNTKIGENVFIMPGTQIHSDVIIGNDVRLNGYICNRSVIGNGASVLGMLVHKYKNGRGGIIENSPVIKDNVIIGMGAIIIGGVTVHENSIVGAGLIITKDIPPNKTMCQNHL